VRLLAGQSRVERRVVGDQLRLLAVTVVVLVARFRVPVLSGRRLGTALGWVLLAGVAVTVRAPGLWVAHVLGVLLVGAAVTLAWFVVRRELGLPLAAAAGGAMTLLAFGLRRPETSWWGRRGTSTRTRCRTPTPR